MGSDPYQEEIFAFRESLEESLRRRNGWLALAGLFWLKEGENMVGAGSTCDVLLPDERYPEKLGSFYLTDQMVRLVITADAQVTFDGEEKEAGEIFPDTADQPTVIELGELRMMIIERGDQFGVRLWDNGRADRHEFSGRDWFPIRPEYRVKAEYKTFGSAQGLKLSRTLGKQVEMQMEGSLEFTLHGEVCRLLALPTDGGGLFLMFLDETSGEETYSSGRYLTTEGPDGGKVLLDFNRAYNPPCAFTDYATCLLPPAQNRLQVAVRAGERYNVPPG
jgi:uncharacterized protein (DUF1684 family)